MAGRAFGSDNQSGAHPEMLAAIAAANEGHVPAYGDDPFTAAAEAVLRGHLGDECDVRFVFGGTGANVLALAAALRPYDCVLCPDTAHIATDECGAPERVLGAKLVTVPSDHGKIAPSDLAPLLHGFGVEHHAQPRVVSVSNVSEMGTVYTPSELRALADLAHARGMLLHVDGARLANAAAALGVPLRALTADAGVDLLSFGGTKNGMLYGEAVVLFGDARRDDFRMLRKGITQLPSKQRFVAAQFAAMYRGDLWSRLASHANAMAARLAEGATRAGVALSHPAEANEVFALLPAGAAETLAARFGFYLWDEAPGCDASVREVRWVTSWDTTGDDVDALVAALPPGG